MTHSPVMTNESLDAPVNYEGIVLTSIDVVDSPIEGNDMRVTFSDTTKGRENDDDAIFLHNIREVGRSVIKKQIMIDFAADRLTPEEAHAMITKKVLFVVHGFATRAGYHLADSLNALKSNKFVKTLLVPIIWPSNDFADYFTYRDDRELSKTAGKALQSMIKPMEGLRASIVSHSMGNRVLRYMADKRFKFDNIFMVAADVNRNIFHKKYITKGSGEYRQHGLKIKSMLRDETGKIHVIYNSGDIRLTQSSIMNFGKRLGATGVDFKGGWFSDSVHEELKDFIVNVNSRKHVDESHEKMLYENKRDHNYHYYDNTIKYYEDNA